jgi:hypothetical protein
MVNLQLAKFFLALKDKLKQTTSFRLSKELLKIR